MKIDPGKKLSPSPVSPLNAPKAAHVKTTRFGDVLKSTVNSETTQAASSSAPIRPIICPSMATSNASEIYASTERMLDTMKQYQQLLADSTTSLHGLGDVVRQFREEISSLEPLVDQMSEGSPIQQIARETLMTAAKEVARFDGGKYI